MRLALLAVLSLSLVACRGTVLDLEDTDNDCDAAVNEGVATAWYADADGDGFGAIAYTVTACVAPAGYVADATDCVDTSAAIHPGADESDCMDPTDYNCDGSVSFADADGDGYSACEDCADHLPGVNPAATERCNGLDDDCDGIADEADAADATTWYADTDGDGYGAPGAGAIACSAPLNYVANASDCDDSTNTISPLATEVCNRVDDNCDGSVDEAEPCACELAGVGTPTPLVSAGSTHGAWLTDPLETLGEDLVWELDSYLGSALVQFPSQAAMVTRTGSITTGLPYSYDGTGAAVYDGYLYYNAANTRNMVKYDIATGTSTLRELPDAGFRNTYHYEWGGYSDIDFAVDEQGLWVIYSTAANSGRVVISKLDDASFTVTDTWYTTSAAKTTLGNAWMMCGVLYTTDGYNGTALVDYAFDTATGTSSYPGLLFSNAQGYNSSINYNPTDGLLRAWDNTYRQTYTTIGG